MKKKAMPITADVAIDFVLETVNAPRPVWLTRQGLVECLHADEPGRSGGPTWKRCSMSVGGGAA